MKHSLRLTLALSATVFLISACSNTPYEDPYETGSTNPIPEAGPLTSGGSYSGTYTQPQPSGGSNYYPPPLAQAQQPQYGGAYNQGGQQGQQGGGYDTYADNSYDQSQGGQQSQQGGGYDTAGSTGAYDYSGGNNDSYDSYSSNTGGNSGGNYYANGSSDNSGGNDYYAGGGNSGGGSIGSSSGRAAVQVFASGSSSKAQQVRSSMASRGLNAVVDSVDGLYKVRIPFGSESEARSNLMRVRSASGESGAFVTFR